MLLGGGPCQGLHKAGAPSAEVSNICSHNTIAYSCHAFQGSYFSRGATEVSTPLLQSVAKPKDIIWLTGVNSVWCVGTLSLHWVSFSVVTSCIT